MDSLKRADHDDVSAKRLENIVTELFSKSLQVILESRSPCSHRLIDKHTTATTENSRKRDRWFNLALRDCCPVIHFQNTGFEHSKQMVVDLVLLQQQRKSVDGEKGAHKVIERWVMMYEGKKGRDDGGLKSGLSSRFRFFYKKCVLMLRSLYAMLKLLPAYKVYRELKVYWKPCEVSLVHYVSCFAEPFAREDEAEMRRYVFEPVDSFSGRLCLSVMYLPCLQDLRISRPSTIEVLIPDYFGAVSVHRVCGSKAFGSGMKTSLNTQPGFHFATQAQLPATSSVRLSTRETSADGVKTEHIGKCQCSPAPFSSILPSALSRMTICPQHGLRQTNVDKCQNSESNGDPLFAKLSDNAALGSLVDVFRTAAPLHLSSTVHPNIVNLPTTGDIPTPSPAVKTALDAIQELQVHINMKRTLLERISTLNNSDNQRLISKSSALENDGI